MLPTLDIFLISAVCFVSGFCLGAFISIKFFFQTNAPPEAIVIK